MNNLTSKLFQFLRFQIAFLTINCYIGMSNHVQEFHKEIF